VAGSRQVAVAYTADLCLPWSMTCSCWAALWKRWHRGVCSSTKMVSDSLVRTWIILPPNSRLILTLLFLKVLW